MSQPYNQQLIVVSKSITILLRILLIILIISAIVPWVIPNSPISTILFGAYGVPNYTTQDFSTIVKHFTILNKMLGLAGTFTSILPLIASIITVLILAKNYAQNKVFTTKNAKLYKLLGIIYLIDALIIRPISNILFSLCATLNTLGHGSIMLTFNMANLTAIFFAIILIIIGKVMQLGQKINEEQELTI